MTTRAQTERDDVLRLIRHIASEPHLVTWLRDHVAGHLEAAAEHLVRTNPTATSVRQVLNRLACAHRLGETPLWGPTRAASEDEPRTPDRRRSWVDSRRIDGRDISVLQTGRGAHARIHLTGLPPLDQDDARWLVNQLATRTLMPTGAKA